MLRASKPFLREVCRKQTICRGFGGVQLLRVGCIAQKFPQTRRLCARRTKGVKHLLRGQIQQAADRCRRGKSARGSRGMKNLVVRAAPKFTDADSDRKSTRLNS